MPLPPIKRRSKKLPSTSHQLILGKGESVRKKARREYDQAKKKLDQARLEITRFKTEDCPAFDAWLHRTFGQTLTELRELNHQYQDKAQLMMEVEDICFTEQVSIGEAYRLALPRRAHPEEIPPPPKAHADAETEFRRKSADQDFPPDEDPEDKEGFAEFAQAFADIFGDELPPGLKPPGLPPKPKANSRVKELYRSLVRKLHPDAHGQMTPEKLEWWHEVQEAYAAADSERLELILNLCEMADGSTASHTSVSMLHRITAQFKASLRAVKRKLTGCRRKPAWKFNQTSDHAVIELRIRAEMEEDRGRLRQMNDDADNLLRHWASLPARKRPGGPRPRQRKTGGKGSFDDGQFLF